MNNIDDDHNHKIWEANILEDSDTYEKFKILVLGDENIISIKKLGNISQKIKSHNIRVLFENIDVNPYIFCKLNNKFLNLKT